ncbi:GSCOCG00002134001-RA-CDS [Cotesia congregata]|nr:GSCOCG00002134001-RA-CDS [Cotesia congregata]
MLIDAQFNKTLQLIDLGCNNIGDHGLESICNWIRGKPALSGLILSHNIITDIGARALSFVLPFSRIILLDVSYNKIKDNGIRDILNIINESTSIRYLRIYGNTISSSAEIIERILKSGVLELDNLDVKPYKVDGKFYAAHYPADHYKQRYYNVSQSNLYSQNPTIFAYVDAPAIKPKQTHEALNCGQELIEYRKGSKESSNSDDSSESLESQSENNYCYCASEDKSLSESSTDWYKVKDSRMQKVMLILDKVDYDLRNYILSRMNTDIQLEQAIDYLNKDN